MAGRTREKRLQVFVSSTYEDLKEERQAAVQAILTAGHIPAGMELFTAGDQSQLKIIEEWIDESDIFLLILGGRYGSIEPNSGKSYVHLEYEYAIKTGTPLFAIAINDAAIESRVKESGRDAAERENPKALAEFRNTVRDRMCRPWDDTKDIKIAILESLSEIERNNDFPGWVRGDTTADMPALTDEMARLSKENSQLREQLSDNRNIDPAIVGLKFEQMKALLESKKLPDKFCRWQSRSDIFWARTTKEQQTIQELLSVGLIEAIPSPTGLRKNRFSAAGIEFSNRLLAEKIPAATDSAPGSTR